MLILMILFKFCILLLLNVFTCFITGKKKTFGMNYFLLILIMVSFFQVRCGNKQSGELGTSSEALDGILGFGQANSSMLSQLASSGKVKKVFSHCLDNVNGGGIFAIGEVVEPKVNLTPLVPNQYVMPSYFYLSFNVLSYLSDCIYNDFSVAAMFTEDVSIYYLRKPLTLYFSY